jgi:hypothetical protein
MYLCLIRPIYMKLVMLASSVELGRLGLQTLGINKSSLECASTP